MLTICIESVCVGVGIVISNYEVLNCGGSWASCVHVGQLGYLNISVSRYSFVWSCEIGVLSPDHGCHILCVVYWSSVLLGEVVKL